MTKQPMIAVMLGNQEDAEHYTVLNNNAYYRNSYIGTFDMQLIKETGSIVATLTLHNKEKIIQTWNNY